MPGAQSPADRSKVKLLHEDAALLHRQQDVTRDFLLQEGIAMRSLNSAVFQVFRYALWTPLRDFFLGVQIVLFLISLMPRNKRRSIPLLSAVDGVHWVAVDRAQWIAVDRADGVALAAVGVGRAWCAHVGNVLIDHTERLVHDRRLHVHRAV